MTDEKLRRMFKEASPQREIERLRAEIARLRLTDAEREAVEWALKEAVWSYSEDTGNHRATLRGLLERIGGGR